MYRVGMYNTIKTHLDLGHSIRSIAKTLGISRNTVRAIARQFGTGQVEPRTQNRKKKLQDYQSEIVSMMNKGKSSVLIHEYLMERYATDVGYTTVSRFVSNLKGTEVYVPVYTPPGQEAQVDFGYIGRFMKYGNKIKVLAFFMVLSYSRYSFYCLVTNQSVESFIRCHWLAFEYFCGVPQVIRIDNLKAGVITPDFFEPVYQEEYARFLEHYSSHPIACRPKTPEHKGKVERGIGYLKENFVKRYNDHVLDYHGMEQKLIVWLESICNARKHGTTRKIPKEVFQQEERTVLQSLPALRYEYPVIEQRKVDSYGHVHYGYNFYSVPDYLAGQELTVKVTGSILRVCQGQLEITCHAVADGKGIYVTKKEHQPSYKTKKDLHWYEDKADEMGDNVKIFMELARQYRQVHWYDYMKGVISLSKCYTHQEINLACKRAITYNNISYRTVKNILDNKLHVQEQESLPPVSFGGWGHELSQYDQIR